MISYFYVFLCKLGQMTMFVGSGKKETYRFESIDDAKKIEKKDFSESQQKEYSGGWIEIHEIGRSSSNFEYSFHKIRHTTKQQLKQLSLF